MTDQPTGYPPTESEGSEPRIPTSGKADDKIFGNTTENVEDRAEEKGPQVTEKGKTRPPQPQAQDTEFPSEQH